MNTTTKINYKSTQGEKMNATKKFNTKERNMKKSMKAMNNPDYKTDTLKCGTGFSAIGTPEQAIKNLSIDHTNEFMIEIDRYARETFLANHSVNNIYTDITSIDPASVADIDLFIFGSPCQSYSIQGKRLGMNDTRGTLIYNGLSILKEKSPKYFIYENVKGMVNHDNGNTFAVIKAAFKELDYNISYQVLNAKNYGAAQNRERLFIVGIRKDIKQKFTFPEPQPVSNCVNNYISKGGDFSNYLFDEEVVPHISKKQTDIQHKFDIPRLSYASDKRVISTNGIAPCFLAGNTKCKFYDEVNGLFRYLTEDELKRIQGFPEDFKFPVSKSQTRKQIGNSIYVGVLEAILKNLIPEHYFTASQVAAMAA